MTPSHPAISSTIGYLRAILTDVSEVARYRKLSPCEANACQIGRRIVDDFDSGKRVAESDIGDAFHNFVKGR